MTAKRFFDITFSLLFFGLLAIPMVAIGIIIKLNSPGPVIHWSSRIGINNKFYRMPKFRTMLRDTPQIATHLFKQSNQFVTPIGRILRKTSADELPQLMSVLKGDMSFVGPRPALFNQYDLISLRTQKGVHRINPGITGWAQINGRDELPIPQKVHYDAYYLSNQSIAFDVRIILRTILNVIRVEGVIH